MTFGTPTVECHSPFSAGLSTVCGNVVGETGDVALTIDLSEYLNEIYGAIIQMSGVSTTINTLDYTTDQKKLDITLPLNSDAITHVGTTDLSSGHDWSLGNETFSINVNGAGVTVVTLNSNTTNVATVVSEINDELTTAGVTGVEAYASGINVGIRTTSSNPNQTIVLAEGTGALATLGWTAGTYSNPSTPITVHFTAFGY